MSLSVEVSGVEAKQSLNPWVLPEKGLTVFYGCPEMPRLSHYFLPRLLLAKKHVLYLDGANQISPLLIARFARERRLEPSVFNKLVRVSRAFTCFQLMELILRVPKFLNTFSANILVVSVTGSRQHASWHPRAKQSKQSEGTSWRSSF
jgi:hypothetical protein